VTTDRHDWDRNEREALAGLEDQIDAMRQRHAGDPPFELLRAAREGVLPSDLQEAVMEHVSASAMSRTLAEGVGDDSPALTAQQEDQLLARIMTDASASASGYGEAGRNRVWKWFRPVLLGSGVVAVASLVWLVSSTTERSERIAPPETTVVVALPPPAPPFLLPYEKPDVRLGMGALTWRGSTGDTNQLLTDLKPGLDAYRSGDYATADRALTSLAVKYPGTIEILFYQGMSRLFLDNLPGALESFTAADAIGDRSFAADVSWYRAVAEQRSGKLADARTRLDALCRAGGDGAARACAALEQLAKAAQ
jgi:hypothetical protein